MQLTFVASPKMYEQDVFVVQASESADRHAVLVQTLCTRIAEALSAHRQSTI